MSMFRKIMGFLVGGTEQNRRTDKGNIVLVPGSIITPYNVFPLNTLAVVSNVIEAKNRILLFVLAFIASLISISALNGLVSAPSAMRVVWFAAIAGITGLLILRLIRTPKTGIRLEASSGTTETILSDDRDFIIELKQKVIESLSPKNTRAAVVNIDNRKITVQGDASFDRSKILKTIAKNFES